MYRDVIVKNLYVYAQKKKRAKERERERENVCASTIGVEDEREDQ
jgi:hypothetical protein